MQGLSGGFVFRRVFPGLRGAGGFDVGFVFVVELFGVELAAELQEAMEIFDGAAVEPLGLSLETKEGGHDIGHAVVAIESECQAVGVVLASRDIAAGREILMAKILGIAGALGEAVGEDTGFEFIEPENGVLREGDPFDRGALLRIDGLVGGEGTGDETCEAVVVLDTGNEEGVGVNVSVCGRSGRSGLCLRACAVQWICSRWRDWRRDVLRKMAWPTV